MRKTDASKTERFVSYRKQETKKLLFGGIQHATCHIPHLSQNVSQQGIRDCSGNRKKGAGIQLLFTMCFSDAECGIKRHDFLIAITAKVFGRELDSIGRLVGIRVDL